jgi:CheY-like chemotaxis protein
MDGWATLDALQTQPETKDIPVVLLSGLPPGECNRPAVVEWLSKPPDDARLSHSLDHALSVPTRGAKILLVEDDWDHVTLFKFIFERHGIDVLHAGTSEAALVLSRQLTPDVVILDLALPDQDGFTVMESLQQQEHLRQVPICIYSIKDLTAAELERIRGTPTQVYVKGSTTPLELERRVLALLGRRLRQHQTQPGSGSDHELLIAS